MSRPVTELLAPTFDEARDGRKDNLEKVSPYPFGTLNIVPVYGLGRRRFPPYNSSSEVGPKYKRRTSKTQCVDSHAS